MALFSRKKKEVAVEAAPKKAVTKASKVAGVSRPSDRDLATVIVQPHLTEKGMGKTEQNVYTFIVRRNATKFDVRDAVKELYKVTPARVNVVHRAPALRHSGSRNRDVMVAGQKKAYVYLKKGDTINLV